MNKEINKAMTQGIVFKKAKGEATDPSGKKIKFSDFLKGTHGSDSNPQGSVSYISERARTSPTLSANSAAAVTKFPRLLPTFVPNPR